MSYEHWKRIFETFSIQEEYHFPEKREYQYFFRVKSIVLENSVFHNLGTILQLEPEEIEMYIDISGMCVYKLLKTHPVFQNRHAFPVLWIFGFCLVYKFYQDRPYSNSTLSKLLQIDNEDYNRMEKYFYYLIGYTFPLSYSQPFYILLNNK